MNLCCWTIWLVFNLDSSLLPFYLSWILQLQCKRSADKLQCLPSCWAFFIYLISPNLVPWTSSLNHSSQSLPSSRPRFGRELCWPQKLSSLLLAFRFYTRQGRQPPCCSKAFSIELFRATSEPFLSLVLKPHHFIWIWSRPAGEAGISDLWHSGLSPVTELTH